MKRKIYRVMVVLLFLLYLGGLSTIVENGWTSPYYALFYVTIGGFVALGLMTIKEK